MLESPDCHGSPTRYIRWCEAWLDDSGSLDAEEPLTGTFLYHLYTAGLIPRQLFCATPEQFEEFVCRALVKAARRWYQQRGADDLTVQQNLDRSGPGGIRLDEQRRENWTGGSMF
jgi:hypothetical protein